MFHLLRAFILVLCIHASRAFVPHFSALPKRSLHYFISLDATVEEEHTEEIFEKLADVALSRDDSVKVLPESSPLSFTKYTTMQQKRVVVTIRYSASAGLKPYFLTVAKKLKASHPDILLEKQILPALSSSDTEAVFEVLVDGKIVIGNGRASKQKPGQVVVMSRARSVFVSMQELDIAIVRSRRKRRPQTVYGDTEGGEM